MHWQDTSVSDQQFEPAAVEHCRAVQEPLVGGVVFQMDQQHLRIKRFLGTSENAVKTQIWCAVSTYVLIAIVKKELPSQQTLIVFCQSALTHG